MNLAERSKKSIWHPFTQMQIADDPIAIVRGKGSYLYDENGKAYLDAVSSWWVTNHGHAHPHIAQKVSEQVAHLEHSMLAGFTHEPAIELAERVLNHLPEGQSKVFFSDNGSTAVEVAIKMAVQYWHNQGQDRTEILAFEDAYHGDTFGAMSAAGPSAFNRPFQPYLFTVQHLPVPIQNAEDHFLQVLEKALQSGRVACFIYEPLVLGAGGMFMYAPELLNKAIAMCKAYQVLCIADEVMTGFGRTGKWFASDYCENKPDIICLSKGLTGGTLPMALTTCTETVYKAFLSDDRFKTFFHGHSFTGNPVGCAAALASMDLMEKQETWERIDAVCQLHSEQVGRFEKLAAVSNVRHRGTLFALDVNTGGETSYFNDLRDWLYRQFIDRGILLRPLGNTLYIMAPYSTTKEQMMEVYQAMEQVLEQVKV
ncbi:MAG: adenosylmethionine--8-amino-7-oxononanoate transaminase [Bacteroidetes bacterium]|nr:adenosylmethionine--8-amino-7-oxononanoate transaminase [Bacteroidota bacterium]